LDRAPCSLSVLLLCRYRLNATNFFCDMISRWLLPHRQINVELFFTSDVRLPHLSEDLLSVAEVVVYLKSAAEMEEVRRNIASVETEIRLGVVSDYHARRILEFKGLSADGKTAMIQEKINSLIQSHSKDYDQGIFSEMQQFLVNCPQEFKNQRDYHHTSRIISNLYSIRKLLRQNIEVFPNKRHVNLKFLKTRLKVGKKEKPVLGILAGLNFLREHELFEAEHLGAAVRRLLPSAHLVPGSTFVDPVKDGPLKTVYLEIEQENGADFTLDEIQTLRTGLADRLKEHIEQLTNPVYMPRNDEEVLRNLMALSRQIRFVSDIPQVIISFDETSGSDLQFTVILVRVQEVGDPSIQELFARKKTGLKYIPDRVRNLGAIRRKFKEGTVFRTTLSKGKFLRSDRSVDLYKARRFLFEEISSVVGDCRDYNGGMILKQSEQIAALKEALGKVGQTYSMLVEKFFHAILPMEMRTSCETEPLKQLFSLLLSAAKAESRLPFAESEVLFKQESKRVLAVLPMIEGEKKRALLKKIEELKIPTHQFIYFSLEIYDTPYMGVMLLSSEKALQDRFVATLL
ncbi:MAG TPA: hypothetical protein VHL30_03030, partial [Chlamydiales bacterium]|nr:hypothetical protein [Chlamydiales bacterium]